MIVLKVAGTGMLLVVFLGLLASCASTKSGEDLLLGLAGLAILGTILAISISLWFI